MNTVAASDASNVHCFQQMSNVLLLQSRAKDDEQVAHQTLLFTIVVPPVAHENAKSKVKPQSPKFAGLRCTCARKWASETLPQLWRLSLPHRKAHFTPARRRANLVRRQYSSITSPSAHRPRRRQYHRHNSPVALARCIEHRETVRHLRLEPQHQARSHLDASSGDDSEKSVTTLSLLQHFDNVDHLNRAI